MPGKRIVVGPSRSKNRIQRRGYDGHPPHNDPVPTFGHTFRFEMTATSNQRININRIQLVNLIIACNTTTSAYAILGSIKINKIMMYGANALDTTGSVASNRIDLIWAGTTGNQGVHSDVSNSTTRPPYISVRPPPYCPAALPSNIATVSANPTGQNAGDGAEVLFSLFASPGAYLDLQTTCVLNDTPSVFNTTVAGVTQGALFYNALDNIAISGAAHVWDAVGIRDSVP